MLKKALRKVAERVKPDPTRDVKLTVATPDAPSEGPDLRASGTNTGDPYIERVRSFQRSPFASTVRREAVGSKARRTKARANAGPVMER